MDVYVLGEKRNTGKRCLAVDSLRIVARPLVVAHHDGVERGVEPFNLVDGRLQHLARRDFA